MQTLLLTLLVGAAEITALASAHEGFTAQKATAGGAQGQEAAIVLEEGKNSCSDGRSKIGQLEHCRAAMDHVGHEGYDFEGDENESDWPQGCYRCGNNVNGCTSQSTWWNTHSSGRAVDKTELYCAGPNFVTAPEILFMGDSDIDYWETTGRFLSSQNVGVGGYTCKNVQKEAQVFLVAFDVPDWLVVVCGENDIASGESVSNTFEQFKKVVAPALIEGTRVLYIGTKPEPDTTSDHSRYRAYDAKVFEYATELASSSSEYDTKAPPLVVIDSYNGFEDNGNPDSFYQNDGLHLRDEGYAFWNTWAGLALADGLCVRWRNSVCVEIQEGGPDGCADDTSWRYKKSSQDCAWTLGKRSRCQRPEGNEEGARTANEACPVTCGTCPRSDGCADDTSWRYKKSSQDCAWTLGKSSRCQRPEGNEEGARTANEACPVTCGTCSI